MKKIILAAAAIATISSCTKSDNIVDATDIWSGELNITSGISTRAVDQTWESGDEIGVYMTETGSTTDYIGAANTPYSTTSNITEADFTVVDPAEPLYYPQSGNVDIMAYYPYVSDIDVDAYPLDVTTQTPSNKIDLMIATAADLAKSKDDVDLSFNHKLSKVVITLTPAENGGLTISDLDGMTSLMSGTIAKGSYDLNATTSPIDFGTNLAADITLPTAVVGSESAVITFIMIPQTAAPTFTFTLGGTDGYSVTASSMEFVGGSEHNYAISISRTAVQINGSTISAWNKSTTESLNATDISYSEDYL